MNVIDWEKELTMKYDESLTLPFVEDENCNITGYGHQDKEAFADAINLYDWKANAWYGDVPEDEKILAEDISHGWAVPVYDMFGDWTLHRVEFDPERDDIIPITTLWGFR